MTRKKNLFRSISGIMQMLWFKETELLKGITWRQRLNTIPIVCKTGAGMTSQTTAVGLKL